MSIKEKFYLPETKFYGRLYGPNDKIIEIDKRLLHLNGTGDSFYYVWHWPGPDVTIYKFSDYGKTWAFSLEDFEKKEEVELGPDN